MRPFNFKRSQISQLSSNEKHGLFAGVGKSFDFIGNTRDLFSKSPDFKPISPIATAKSYQLATLHQTSEIFFAYF